MNNEPSMDEAFLGKLREIVEKNLRDDQFGVRELAKEAGISRSQIHRKLKDLTGKSTSQFIREIRLEHSLEMLQRNEATVSEIAYRVGFSSPTYFSTCFHNFFGFPPGEASRLENKEYVNEAAESEPSETGSKPNARKIVYAAAMLVLLVILITGYYYQSSMKPSEPNSESIAVLPLYNLTGEEEQDYFVDGLHDALIGELGQLSDLRVISRTSTLRYRNSKSNITDIAEELGVKNLIEGSVYKVGDSIRIQLQLIAVEPEEQHLWAEDYARSTGDVLVMLSEVTKEIANEVNVTLTPAEDSLLADQRKVNPEAYKAYLRGRYHLTKFTPEGYDKGISYLLKATRVDPADPLPWARLALGYNTAGHGGDQPPDAFNKAKAAAEKALKLDPSFGEIHLARALVDLY
ncbi:MAG: helix-turn-helix domain-containing protein, partial [Balneolaceae bacterium]|nr:helix-turn-helix domain-containing protein [Balneolaceae bacterium]